MKIYVESKELLNGLSHFNTPLQLEEMCNETGLHFEQDDIYNCYVQKTLIVKHLKKLKCR